jgi:hypothetical protein
MGALDAIHPEAVSGSQPDADQTPPLAARPHRFAGLQVTFVLHFDNTRG